MAAEPTTIADLIPDRGNPRRRGVRAKQLLRQSLKELGAARSIVIDEAGNILAGNGTVEAAGDVGIQRLLVVDADGETIVAVRRSDLTESEKRRLAVLDNRTGELAEWDPEALAGMNLAGLWNGEELKALLPPMPKQDTADLPEREVPEGFYVSAYCPNEPTQQALIAQLRAEGYECGGGIGNPAGHWQNIRRRGERSE